MPLHLRKRAGVWHYSRTVPEDVRGVLGKRYWRFTLGTGNLREAEAQRSQWDAKFQAEIDEVRRMTAPHKMSAIRRLHKPTFEGLAPVGSVNSGIEVHRLPLRKRDVWKRRGTKTDTRAAFQEAEDHALRQAAALLPNLTDSDRAEVAKAGSIEKLYRSVVHASERTDLTGDYRSVSRSERAGIQQEVEARWLGAKQDIVAKLGIDLAQPTDLPETADNPRLLAALEKWLAVNKQKPSTVVKYRLHVRRLAEYTGNLTVKALTPDIISRFVEAYSELPNARKLTLDQRKFKMPELLALRALNPHLPAMGAVNVRKMIEYLRAYLRAIERDDLRAFAKKPKDDRSHAEKQEGYPPIKPEHMRVLLPAADERFGPQSDTAWWIWLMAYSGMRPEEAAQLARSNIFRTGNIWAIKIDDLDARRIKNSQSLRTIPVHPVLIESGFLEFAHPEGNTSGLLFRSFAYDDKGGRANNPSRRLKVLLLKLSISGKGSAHRFRPSFIDAIRNAQLPYAVELGLVGHTDKNRVHGRYGEGASLKTLTRVIGKVDPLSD